MKIEDLRINQMVRVNDSKYPEWNGEFRVVGLRTYVDGESIVTLDDGTPSGAEWYIKYITEV